MWCSDTILVQHMLWPCFCLSQANVQLKWLNGSSCFLVHRLPLAYPTLCFKGIQVQPFSITRVLPSGALSQTLSLADFSAFLAMAHPSLLTAESCNHTLRLIPLRAILCLLLVLSWNLGILISHQSAFDAILPWGSLLFIFQSFRSTNC